MADGGELKKALDRYSDARRMDLSPLMGKGKASARPWFDDRDVSVTRIYRSRRFTVLRSILYGCLAVGAAALLYMGALWYVDQYQTTEREAAGEAETPAAATQSPPVAEPSAAEDTATVAPPKPAPPSPEKVRAKLTRKLAAVPPADSGKLFIYTEPWAKVEIDGRDHGATPLEAPISLLRGRHVIRLHNDFCEPFEDEVDIVSGTVVRRRYVLQKKPAYRQ
jgi:hypothetical protein